jgi:hypothetical protein
MLALYLTWRTWRKAWARWPAPTRTRRRRLIRVAPATRSASAQAKTSARQSRDGQPARSYHGLLARLAAMSRNQVLNGAQHSHWFGRVRGA